MKLHRRRFVFASAGIALVLASGCGKKSPKMRAVAAGATVLALGDSITFGTGTTPETSYPVVLARLSAWNVINAGIPGNTTVQALERLPQLLEEHKPQLVLVSIGGNDFLRRTGEAEAKANIRRICEQSIASGAQVLLIAVPRPSMVGAVAGSLSDHPMYGELADELKLPLQRQGWSDVLSDQRLRSDQIHANAQGYEQFANRVLETVRSVGLLEGGKK